MIGSILLAVVVLAVLAWVVVRPPRSGHVESETVIEGRRSALSRFYGPTNY